MRTVLALGAMVLLGGCNVVVTKAPLFAAADEAGAPPLKAGVWVMEDADCQFDERKAIPDWPDCAGGMVFKDGVAISNNRKDGKDHWERQPLILAAGDPRIGQLLFHMDISSGAHSSSDQMMYGYAAVRPTRLGPEGRIIGVTYWMVQCGPPPPPSSKPKDDFKFGTRKPLPGIEMKPGDALCTTKSISALRGAAKASEVWREKPMNAHWARPAGPRDLPPQ